MISCLTLSKSIKPINHQILTKSQSLKKKQEQYETMKRNFNIPLNIKLYFATLQQNYHFGTSQSEEKWIHKAFIQGFQQLSKQQQLDILLKNVTFIGQMLKHSNQYINAKSTNAMNTIDIKCQQKTIVFGIPIWSNVGFKFNDTKRQIRISYKGSQFLLDLKLYLIRKSKIHENMIIFQPSSPEISNNRKLIFLFDTSIYSQVYNTVLNCIIDYQNIKLHHILINNNQKIQNLNLYSLNHKQLVPELLFLNSKNINSYHKKKQEILKFISNSLFGFVTLHEHKGVKISISTKIKKSYKMQSNFQCSVTQLKQKFNEAYKRFKYLDSYQILEKFSQKYKAIFKRYKIESQQISMIALEQTEQSRNNILFLKGIDNSINNGFLDFMVVKGIEIGVHCSRLVIYLNCSGNIKHETNMIIPFLTQFSDMIINHKQRQQDQTIFQPQCTNNDQFYTIMQSFQQEMILDEQINELQQEIQLNQFENKISDKSTAQTPKNNSEDNIIPGHYSYLQHKFQIQPYIPEKKRYLKQHYLFTNYIRKQQGGFASIDEQFVKQQSKILQHIFKSIGKSLLSGKLSILNVSLPIGIFKKQSHLTTIARNYTYAPKIFEDIKLSNPVQKLKKTLIFSISMLGLGISQSKPFNPILGQTYQASIDGCPINIQQISHHPAISSLIMHGRGYIIHGIIQLGASIGFNKVVGFDKGYEYIIFEDGTKHQIKTAPMEINKLLIGERIYNYTEKSYVVDYENKLFGEVNYGPRPTNFFESAKQPIDFLYGKIFRVSDKFIAKFKNDKQKKFPQKKDIVQEISHIEGIWSESVKIDNQEVCNFKIQMPFQLIEEQYPLQSHSTYREDILHFIEGNKDEAQKWKDQLENIQRRDKKLRQQHKKVE